MKSKKGGFAGYVAILAGSNALASLFVFATIPIVTRLFEPADYGVAALLITLITFLGALSPLRYERAGVLPADDEMAARLFWLATAISIVICSITVCYIIVAKMFGFWGLYDEQLGDWIYIVPLGALMYSLNLIMTTWLVRARKYKKVALTDMMDPVLAATSRMSLGFLFGGSVWALVVSTLFGLVAKFAALMRNAGVYSKSKLSSFELGPFKRAAIEYKDFPLYNAPSGFVNRLATDMPLLIFGYLYSPEVVGVYAIALRLLQTPVQVCSNAVRKVFYPKAAECVNQRSLLTPILAKLTLFSLAVAAGPFFLVIYYGEFLVTVLLGKNWGEAGVYVQIIAPWLLFRWLSMPCSVIVEVLRKQAMWLYVQIFHVVSRGAVFIAIGLYSIGPDDALRYFVMVSVAGNILVLAIGLRYTIVYDNELKAS